MGQGAEPPTLVRRVRFFVPKQTDSHHRALPDHSLCMRASTSASCVVFLLERDDCVQMTRA
jgi:hypothetical protein